MARIIQTAALTRDRMSEPTDENDWIYNGLDCAVTLEIRDELRQHMDNVAANTYQFSRDLQGPILEMSMRGILIDDRRRKELLSLYKQQIAQVEDQLDYILRDGIGLQYEFKGKTKFWRSRDFVKHIFYNVLNLTPIKKRNSNGIFTPSVDRDAIERLAINFIAEPIANRILLLRDLDKKRSWLETGIDPDGRFRSNFNIAGTNTGRLASSVSDFGTGSNAQNVDRELRSVFVADEGYKLCNVDLEQGDSRNVGALCWNIFVESMGESYAGSYLDACESRDLHTYVARLVWPDLGWNGDYTHDRKIADVLFYRQDSYRQMSKKGGHGTNYYGTPSTMAKHLKVDRSIIERFQFGYFNAFPVIGAYDPQTKTHSRDRSKKNYHNWVRAQLEEDHAITTPYGRRRVFFGRENDDSTLREAIAYSPQSMTADAIDTGLLRLFRANRVQLLAQVHDSILFQFPEKEQDAIVPWALEELKVHLPLARGRDFYIPTEAKIGWNWGDVVYNEDGSIKENPDGLIKWKGGDDRKRQGYTKLSLLDHLR